MGEPGDVWTGMLPSLGFGGVLGAAVGYTVKKGAKLAAILLGLVFIAFQIASWYGLLHVDWHAVELAAEDAWTDDQGVTLATHAWSLLSANLPFGGAFAAGFAAGFKLG